MSNSNRLRFFEIILAALLLVGIHPPLLGALVPFRDSKAAIQMGKDIARIAAEATASSSIDQPGVFVPHTMLVHPVQAA